MLAGAEPGIAILLGFVLLRRETAALVRSVAKRLRGALAAGAPPIDLAGFHHDLDRRFAGNRRDSIRHDSFSGKSPLRSGSFGIVIASLAAGEGLPEDEK